MKLLGTVVIFCMVSLACADLAPVFNRLPNRRIQIIIPADGIWWANVPDVISEDEDTVKYVIKYTLKDYVYETKGSTHLTSARFSQLFLDGSLPNLAKGRTVWTVEESPMQKFGTERAKVKVTKAKKTITVDHFGDDYLTNGNLNVNAIWGQCTSLDNRGCHLSGAGQIPPTMSAMLMSKASIRYGRVTVNAKLPKGDWLWPAIWLLPTEKHYGNWPRSGEIDIMEARGNQHYHQHWGHQSSMGRDYTHAALHYGSKWDKPHKRDQEAEFRITGTTFADSFHSYWMEWTADYIRLGVDEHTMLAWDTPAHGYWQQSQLQGNDIWASGGKDAPFDRPFYLILNVAVGGGWFWEGMGNEPCPQPWHSNATKSQQFIQFWNARHLWEPTWHGRNVAMKIRSVTMEQF